MKETLAFQITVLYREFLAYTTAALKQCGVSFGQMPFIVYVGKHPRATQAELKRDLALDWGYTQRCISRLVEHGFIRKEYDGESACHCLSLTEAGREAFAVSHQVFQAWDQIKTKALTAEEQKILTQLLRKVAAAAEES